MSENNIEEPAGEELVARLNSLVEELEQYPDTEVRDKALDLVQNNPSALWRIPAPNNRDPGVRTAPRADPGAPYRRRSHSLNTADPRAHAS